MDHAQAFQRSFAAGAAALALAVSGQALTAPVAYRSSCPTQAVRIPAPHLSIPGTLAQRGARAVIGAMLNGWC
jgi:hypothetical protein